MRIAFLGSVVLILAIGSGGAAILGAQPSNFGLSSYEHFALQYTTFEGKTVQVTEKDAYIPGYQFPYGPFLVTLWQIKIPGDRARARGLGGGVRESVHSRVFHGVFSPPRACNRAGGSTFWNSVFEPWRSRRNRNRETSVWPTPRVYGPTFFTADKPVRRFDLYPTFLQDAADRARRHGPGRQPVPLHQRRPGPAQMAGLRDGRHVLGDPVHGSLGPGAGAVRSPVHPVASNLAGPVRLPAETDLEEAVNWYRKEQLARPHIVSLQPHPGLEHHSSGHPGQHVRGGRGRLVQHGGAAERPV